MIRTVLVGLAALLLPSLSAFAHDQNAAFIEKAGDKYELRMESKTKSSSASSSGSSSSRNTLTERVVKVTESGLELEFDLPEDTPVKDRMRNWQFPARVFKPFGGSFQLLNESELEERLSLWLETGGIDRSACGQWILSWTAIQINCDPQSVLEILRPFDLRFGPLGEGGLFKDAGTKSASPLRIERQHTASTVFVAEMELDTEAIRLARAEADVAVAQMTGQPPLLFSEALDARSSEQITGTMDTSIEIASDHRVIRVTRKTEAEITADGATEYQSTISSVERVPVSGRDGEAPEPNGPN